VGWLLLIGLTALALFASIAAALQTKPEGRAELGVATALAFTAMIGAPIYVLGYSNTLYAWSLAALSIATSSATIAACARRNPRRLAREVWTAARDLARMVPDGLHESASARSGVFVILFFCLGLELVALVLTWAVTVNGWDDFLYHTPIIGFAIQQHGFSVVNIPLDMSVQGINGYPRLCEATALWFVIFTDRTLIELPSALYVLPLMLVMYALARRYATRVHAMGLAGVLFLVPHVWHTLCSTYNDLEVAFFLTCGLYYASKPTIRRADAVLGWIALAFVIASKITWLVFVPPIALVLALRHRRLAVLAFGFALCAVVASLHLVRNLVAFDDPFWPFTFESDKLHIHWIGFRTYSGVATDPPITDSFSPPTGGMGDMFHRGYGLAVMWIGVPVAAIAIGIWLERAARDFWRTKKLGAAWTLGALLIPALVEIKTSPTLMQPRYNAHIVAALLTAGAWWLGQSAWRRARENVLGAMIALSIIPFFWLNDANVASLAEEKEHVLHPFAPRAYSEHTGFDWLAKPKYDEIHAGDEVDFSDRVAFIGALWNFDFSNRVVYVPFRSPRTFYEELDRNHAKWVCVSRGTAAATALERNARWSFVGQTTDGLPEIVYRRR